MPSPTEEHLQEKSRKAREELRGFLPADRSAQTALAEHLLKQQETLFAILQLQTENRTKVNDMRAAVKRMEKEMATLGKKDDFSALQVSDTIGKERSLSQRWAPPGAWLQARLQSKPTSPEVSVSISGEASFMERPEDVQSATRTASRTASRLPSGAFSASSINDVLGLAAGAGCGYKISLKESDGGATEQTKEELQFLQGIQEELPARVVQFSFCGFPTDMMAVLDAVSTVLVLCHAVFAGIQVNTSMESVFTGKALDEWLEYVDVSFSCAFAVECGLRWWLMGRIFFTGQDRYWNWMDLFFVGSSMIDLILVFTDLSFVRAIRILRVIRAFRALRGMRFIPDLRLMLAAIMSSTASFMWGCGLFFFVLYVAAISLMQSLVVAKGSSNVVYDPAIWKHYGTVATSIISLFKAVSGGKDWDDLLQPLQQVSDAFVVFYLAYVFIVLFGLTNILTAVFCENANQIGQVDKDFVIRTEIARAKELSRDIKKFFMYADANNDGLLTVAELEHFLSSPERCAMLTLLNVDVAEARGLFELMDTNNAGVVDLNAYVDAVMRLKGAAKGCDAAMLLFESKRVLIRLASFMSFTCDSFKLLFEELNIDAAAVPLHSYVSPDVLREQEAEVKKEMRLGLAAHLGICAADISEKGEHSVAELATGALSHFTGTLKTNFTRFVVDERFGATPGTSPPTSPVVSACMGDQSSYKDRTDM